MLEEPNQLTRAAYVLYQLSIPEADPVIDLLVLYHPKLPDAQILKGSSLICQGKADEVGDNFERALTVGIPIYTESVRLLRDGLNFLKGRHPNDRRIRSNADLANRMAASANFESELTCLRLGNEIKIEVLDEGHHETTVPSRTGPHLPTLSPPVTPVVPEVPSNHTPTPPHPQPVGTIQVGFRVPNLAGLDRAEARRAVEDSDTMVLIGSLSVPREGTAKIFNSKSAKLKSGLLNRRERSSDRIQSLDSSC